MPLFVSCGSSSCSAGQERTERTSAQKVEMGMEDLLAAVSADIGD